MSFPTSHAMMPIISIVVITSLMLQTACGFPTALTLKRASATNHPRTVPVFGFPLQGSIDPYHVGEYYTRVQLGSPPREYYVQIDTGRSEVWVGCHACDTCPTSSGLGDVSSTWCLDLQEMRGQGLTILGDLVLKDKIVVYDLDAQRIGWMNYDCTLLMRLLEPTVDTSDDGP